MYLVSQLAAPQLGVVLLGDAGEGLREDAVWVEGLLSQGAGASCGRYNKFSNIFSSPVLGPAAYLWPIGIAALPFLIHAVIAHPPPPGHCVTPQMGQGCNSALEDCHQLAQALQRAGYDTAAGLAAFNATRAPQVRTGGGRQLAY
jgi:hypothetical protein